MQTGVIFSFKKRDAKSDRAQISRALTFNMKEGSFLGALVVPLRLSEFFFLNVHDRNPQCFLFLFLFELIKLFCYAF